MKLIFFGTSEFAVDILRIISKRCSVVAVVTQPDRKKGRNLKVSAPPVKEEAAKLGITVLQPADVNSPQFAAELKELQADAFVVVSFGEMLGKELLGIPKFGPFNIHPSLLPKYRGAAPINRAILAGEKKTGVTIIRMNEKLDAGDIILQKEVIIGETDTSETLSDTLAARGADLLIEAVKSAEAGRAKFIKQNEAEATFAPKLKKEDGIIRWDLPTVTILNMIRALKPWPGAYTNLDGRMLKIISAAEVNGGTFSGFSHGEVITADEKGGFTVKTKDGAISLLKVQVEGKKEMPA
ncbi:MAG: methionyl-tRNA formyltransferase, partial [Candidatus Omnitrophica bacterium]|nr:methionyl-tRNA formyltransferase [Candidatus Omnitrophota bacterium]